MKIILLIIPIFHTIQMYIYFLFILENLHTLMEKTIHFGAIKCVVIYFPSILVFGKLSKVECILIALITL
jgi:DNA integrity scanning protein DisA with diadenylate cyclase activity